MEKHVLLLALLVFAAAALIGCAGGAASGSKGSSADAASYQQVSAQEAKAIMDSEQGYVIVDARTQAEYQQGHVPGALLIPHDAIEAKAGELLPDKDQLILVYCRSGNRSKQASEALVDMGYTNIVEFGGINTWPYDIEK